MDSSFLTGLHIGLSLFACLLFLKLIRQFGLPNHPARFVSYLVALSVTVYFVGLALTDLSFISPWEWMKWRALPLICGSLFLLLQTVMLATSFSPLQQKVISRIPLMASLLCFAFFADLADHFVVTFLLLAGLFLSISVKKARYQKRLFLKMLLMFFIHVGLNLMNVYWAWVLGQMVLFFAVFYVFLFEHSFGITALVDDFKQSLEGDAR